MKKKLALLFAVIAFVGLGMQENCRAGTSKRKKKEIQKLLNKRNIIALPSVSSQVSTSSSSSSGPDDSFTISSKRFTALGGTKPPTLESIPQSPIKDIFWRSVNGINIIDGLNGGLKDPPFCGEFLGGRADGESGGLGACHMAEGVGYSYSVILNSGRSLCYMQNFPSSKNLKSGGIVVNSGSLPEGGIEKLFSAPAEGIARLVKVNVSGAPNPDLIPDRRPDPNTIFLKVFSQSEAKAAGNIYQAHVWFCDESKSTIANGYDMLSVTDKLEFTNVHGSSDKFGKNMTTVTGFLRQDGNKLEWNSKRSRTAEAIFAAKGGDRFRSQIDIGSDAKITLRRLDLFKGRLGKGISIVKYSGNSVENLRFLSGAFNEIHRDRQTIAATEYRKTYYATDIKNSLLDDVEKESLESDFYNSSLELNLDMSAFPCTDTPDIELTMDISNETLKTSLKECAPDSFGNMHFCHDDPLVSQAEDNFKSQCPLK